MKIIKASSKLNDQKIRKQAAIPTASPMYSWSRNFCCAWNFWIPFSNNF